VRHKSELFRDTIVKKLIVALALATASGSSLHAQQQTCDRTQVLWCPGDVFVGIGGIVDQLTSSPPKKVPADEVCVPYTDDNGNPVLDAGGKQVYDCTLETNPGRYVLHNGSTGLPVAGPNGNVTLIDAVAAGAPLTDAASGQPVTTVQTVNPITGLNATTEQNSYTTGCAQDPVTGDLVTTGFWSNVITRFPYGSASAATRGIDLGALTRITCDQSLSDKFGKCGAPSSVVFDKQGNYYVGTTSGTNKILKFNAANQWVDTYTVPVPPPPFGRGTDWIELAADQVTMYYTSEGNSIFVFRTDRHPLTESMVKDQVTGQMMNVFQAGVQHYADPILDPGAASNLFGQIVIKNGGTPIGNLTYGLRLLAPGDGGGGLLVVVDYDVFRIGLDGNLRRGFITPDLQQRFQHFQAIDVTPDGRSVWLQNTPFNNATGLYEPDVTPTALLQFDIPTGQLIAGPYAPFGGAAFGVCVVKEYVAGARQPDCTLNPTHPLCRPLPNCIETPGDPACVLPQAPQIAPIADRTSREGDVVSAADWTPPITVTDTTGTPLTFAVSALPPGLTFDPVTRTIVGTVSYRAVETMGVPTIPITVTVTDGRGFSSSRTFSWTIIDVDAPVVLGAVSPSPTISTPHGLDISSPQSLGGPVTITATDVDPCDETVFDWGPVVPIPGLQLTRILTAPLSCTPGRIYTGVISGTPTLPGPFPKTTTFTVHAIDNRGSDVPVTFTWTLTNEPPAVVNPGGQLTKPNVAVALVVSASDPNHDPIAFSDVVNGVHSLPPGLTIDPVSGVISGAPSATGTYPVTLTVTDSFGANTVVTFPWQVSSNRSPICSVAIATADLWPPNHKFQPVSIAGITDPDGDRVSIRITGIQQDEPTLVAGSGETAIDGMGVGTPTAQVRAERSGLYGGRLYFISFSADDGKGGACTGTVTVGVPHDQGQGTAPVDSGMRFDSTVPGVPRVR
jgi:hypothetical protein